MIFAKQHAFRPSWRSSRQIAARGALLLVLGLVACAPLAGPNAPRTVTVFAAASLTDAFNELATAFEARERDVDLLLNFAGSSQLARQLAEGATADIFAAANAAQMQNSVAAGRIEAGTAVPFVSNRLTVIVPVDNPARIGTLNDLAQPGIQLIVAARGVPVRDYTDEVVAGLPAEAQAGFRENIVSEEDNVRRVAAKVALGEADAGIVYASDVTADIAGLVQQIPIPREQNIIAEYPIAPLVDAPQPELARQFIDFVLSAEGQAILARWGFGPPRER